MAKMTAAALGLVTFAFITLILFFALASPFGMIMDLVSEQADAAHMNVTSGNVTGYLNNFQIVFGLTFILSFVGLISWAILTSHFEEGEEYS